MLTPAEFEAVVAGALWREERQDDRIARLLAPHLKDGMSLRDLLSGRRLGESLVPGYRVEDQDG